MPRIIATSFQSEFRGVVKSVNAALLLSQLVYWYKLKLGRSKLKVVRKGHYWVAKRREDWTVECGLSPRQYDSAIKYLREAGIVETKVFHFAGHPTTHVRILEEALQKFPILQKCHIHIPKPLVPYHDSVIPYTDTTNRDYITEKAGAAVPQEEPPAVLTEPVREEQSQATPEFCNQVQNREIDNWVADRPELAQQRLKTRFTAEEWMMKASEILKLHNEGLTAKAYRLTANSLATAWKLEYSQRYGEFVKDFTHKEMGQMKLLIQKSGETTPDLLRLVLRDWSDFVYEAKLKKGLSVTPERPVIGFVLQYYDVAMQLLAKPKALAKVNPLTVPKKVSAPSSMPTVDEPKATIEDVMAELADSRVNL